MCLCILPQSDCFIHSGQSRHGHPYKAAQLSQSLSLPLPPPRRASLTCPVFRLYEKSFQEYQVTHSRRDMTHDEKPLAWLYVECLILLKSANANKMWCLKKSECQGAWFDAKPPTNASCSDWPVWNRCFFPNLDDTCPTSTMPFETRPSYPSSLLRV